MALAYFENTSLLTAQGGGAKIPIAVKIVNMVEQLLLIYLPHWVLKIPKYLKLSLRFALWKFYQSAGDKLLRAIQGEVANMQQIQRLRDTIIRSRKLHISRLSILKEPRMEDGRR